MTTQTTLDFSTLIKNMVKTLDLKMASTSWNDFDKWLRGEVASMDRGAIELTSDEHDNPLEKRINCKVIVPGEPPLRWHNPVILWLEHFCQVFARNVPVLPTRKNTVMVLEVRTLGEDIHVVGYCVREPDYLNYMALLRNGMALVFLVEDNGSYTLGGGLPRMVGKLNHAFDLVLPTTPTYFANWLRSEMLRMGSVTAVQPAPAVYAAEDWGISLSEAESEATEVVILPRSLKIIQPHEPPLFWCNPVALWDGKIHVHRFAVSGEPVNPYYNMKHLAILEVREVEEAVQVVGYCLDRDDLQGFMARLRDRIARAFPADQDNRPTGDQREVEGKETRQRQGIRAGTSERVKEFHRLRKAGWTVNMAGKQSHCDLRTYWRHCRKVTKEEPILSLQDDDG